MSYALKTKQTFAKSDEREIRETPENTEARYISLREATNLCRYTQEYLSLRARQGKLRAVKIGKNWATTKKWLQEYIGKSEDYKKTLEAKRLAESAAIPWPDPPRNLPVFAPDADKWEAPMPAELAARLAFWRKAQFACATALVFALVLVGGMQGRESVLRLADTAHVAFMSSATGTLSQAERLGLTAGQSAYAAGFGSFAREYVAWLGDGVRGIVAWFGPGASNVSNQVTHTAIPMDVKQGMVVVPSDKDTERVSNQVTHIRQSFSDEVLVTPQDEDSGIITPVFRDRTGEDYLYILVPIRGQE